MKSNLINIMLFKSKIKRKFKKSVMLKPGMSFVF